MPASFPGHTWRLRISLKSRIHVAPAHFEICTKLNLLCGSSGAMRFKCGLVSAIITSERV